MALPTKRGVEAAIAILDAVVIEDKSVVGAQQLWHKLKDLTASIENFDVMYNNLAQVPAGWWSKTSGSLLRGVTFDIQLTDQIEASLVVALASDGEIGIAAGGVETPVGTRFRVLDNADVMNDDLERIKGFPVVAGDLFRVTAPSVVIYLGTFADL